MTMMNKWNYGIMITPVMDSYVVLYLLLFHPCGNWIACGKNTGIKLWNEQGSKEQKN
jgi:hypothetical protein